MELLKASDMSDLVNKYHKDYNELCDKIKKAAGAGKERIEVPAIANSEIRHLLEEGNFMINHIDKDTDIIYWGS